MRLRKLALAVGLAGTMSAQMASALGLGEIKLHSKLNEPLNAEIRLLQVKDLTKSEVLVELASSDDFKRAGIDRVFFLTDLRFEVALDAQSGPVIRVTSQKPVKEPYLNFLLESQWPNGRILREYTLLMDLPTFAEQRAAPVQSARTSSPAVTAASGTAAPAASTPGTAPAARSQTSSPAAAAPSYQGEVYGPVSANDTLWEIALKVRPGRQYSVQQTMLALQRLNPDAFINGNINLLRKGQVLRVPANTDLDSIGTQQAINEVAQQNSAWSELSGTAVGPQLEGSKRARTAATGSGDGVSGRLTVAGANAAESAQSGRAAGEASGDASALQGELSSSLEELDSARRENVELKDRVAEMEEQIQTMERLLEVSSEEFRALQQGIAARSAEESGDTKDPVTDESVELVAPADEPVIAETAAPVQSPVAQPEARARDAAKVVRSAPAQAPSFMDMIINNILYIGAALLAILAAVFFLLRRRKTEEDQQAEGISIAPAAAAAAAVTTADIDAAIGSGVADDFDMSYDDVDLAEEDSLFADDAAPVEPQTGDAVAEADIYIAYGKLDQAEDMLQKALEQDPVNTAARVKLMEVFLETQELDKFDHQYGEVMAWGDAANIDRAESLRQQFADAPAYISGGADAAENEFALGDETLSFDLDDDPLAEPYETESHETEPHEAKASEFQVGEDFSLRFATSLTSISNSESAQSIDADDEQLLDMDESADDFLATLDADELTFDLADDEAPLTLDLSEVDGAAEDGVGDSSLAGIKFDEELDDLNLEFDTAADDDDAFDLDMDEMDLAALDEEVSALSENIDFAGEEFGFDEKFGSDEKFGLDEEPNLTKELTLEADTLAAETVSDLGELSMDELSLDEDEFSLDTLDLDDLSFEGGELALDDDELTLDLDDDFTAEFAAGLEQDEVPTLLLVDTDALEDAPVPVSAAEAEEAELEELEFEDLELENLEFEEFDLAADLGLDKDDFATGKELSEEEAFSEAMSQLPTPEDVMAEDMSDEELDAELDFLADTDEAATKLDLARAYIDMGDQEGAKDILGEVVVEGNDVQKQEAEELLARIG